MLMLYQWEMANADVEVWIVGKTHNEAEFSHHILNSKDIAKYELIDQTNLVLFDESSHHLTFVVFYDCSELNKIEDIQWELCAQINKHTYHIQHHAVEQQGVCVGMYSILSMYYVNIVFLYFKRLGWRAGFNKRQLFGLYTKKQGTTQTEYNDFMDLGAQIICAHQQIIEAWQGQWLINH